MTYWARWLIELGDLSSSVTYRARFFKRRKKEKKLEIKAIMTTWSTKSKTPSRSQFVTDKKHCVAGRLMLFWYLKKYWQKNILFYPFFFDIFDARLPSVNGAWIERFNFESYSFEKILRALFFPLESFDFIGTQSAIQCIKENIHFFVSFLFVMNFAWYYANKQTAPCMSLGGFHGLMLQKKKLFRMTIKMLLRKKDSKRQTTILLLFLIVSFNGKALLENGYS